MESARLILTVCIALTIPSAGGAQSRADLARVSPRITNGVAVPSGQGAWAASIRRPATEDPSRYVHFCGGSFVSPKYNAATRRVEDWSGGNNSPQWLVTAAHCLIKEGKVIGEGDLRIVGGTTDLGSAINGEEQTVERIFLHPRYSEATLENDIALLKLSPPVKRVSPTLRTSIRLPNIPDVNWISKPYLALRAQGWGRTEYGYESPLLREVTVPQVDRQTCINSLAPQGEALPEGAICGGFVSGDFDSCQGDSGGPLVYRSINSAPSPGFRADPTLVGVISWGIGCGLADLYGIYTSMFFHRRWAEETVVSFHSK